MIWYSFNCTFGFYSVCIKLFWILNLRQWHPHPTTGQVLQTSQTPDLISEEEDEPVFPITPGLFAAIFCNKFKYIGNIDFLLFNLFLSTHLNVFIQYSEWWTWFVSIIVFITALLIQQRGECWWGDVQQKITNYHFINTTKNIE